MSDLSDSHCKVTIFSKITGEIGYAHEQQNKLHLEILRKWENLKVQFSCTNYKIEALLTSKAIGVVKNECQYRCSYIIITIFILCSTEQKHFPYSRTVVQFSMSSIAHWCAAMSNYQEMHQKLLACHMLLLPLFSLNKFKTTSTPKTD